MFFAIFGNSHQPAHRMAAIGRFFNQLTLRGVTVAIEREFACYLSAKIQGFPRFETFAGGEIPAGADIAVCLGGDGTFLSTARLIGATGLPVAGVNTGHLGYLADVDIDEAFRLTDAVISGDYRVEPRSVLQVTVPDHDLGMSPYALNEVAILRDDTASMIEVHARLDGRPLSDYRGDGLIVSTPTGSTGYNLSVSGPIIAPDAPALSIAPIAPHSLTMRPLVVSDTCVVEVTTESRASRFRLSLDGRSVTLPLSASVRIGRAPFTVNIVHRPQHSFASTLRSKLLWGS